MIEKTLIVLKPDAVADRNALPILEEFQSAFLNAIEMKMVRFDDQMVEKLYGQHKGKSFYDGNAEFMKSGRSVIIVLEGEGAIAKVRKMVGGLNELGTIRARYGTKNPCNAVHASDSPEAAAREIKAFFGE